MSKGSVPPSPSSHGVAVGSGGFAGADGLPAKFGKYTLIRKLATGGMAELFLAIQKSVAGFEKILVIKRILPAMNQDRAFIDMLLHEARVAATLSHPNIVQIFDVGQADGQYFIAMEHVHGEDLRSIVRQMKKKGILEFPLEYALAITLGMCAGLSYAHEKRELDGSELKIVHRDISPQNVVVTFTGDVKIVDFGIAKSDGNVLENTKTGKLKGKVPYMSPEQARGEHVDSRSDVFSMSVMLFELTTGRRLFKGQSEYETLKLICDRDYPHPSDIVEGYPMDLEAIVMKGLAKDRNARYQSAREMQADIEGFIRRHQIAVSTIAQSQFMQSIFEEKLAAQKEALLQGKQLADIIEMQHALTAAVEGPDASSQRAQSTLSMPAAARTVTGIAARSYTPRRWIYGVAGAVVLGAVAGGVAYYVFAKDRAGAAAAFTPSVPPAVRCALQVESDPPGASIWINGDLRSQVTPATIENLPAAVPLDVKLTKDGFEVVKQELKLKEGVISKMKIALKKGSVTVEVKIAPDGAVPTLFLDDKNVSGPRIDGVSSGEVHTLVVTAPGFVDQAVNFTGAPLETKHLDVTLEKATLARRPTPRAPAPQDPMPSPAPAPATPQAQGSGKLNVGASNGWCNIAVDGVQRGATPVAGLELSTGPHRVSCTTPDGKTRDATVSVPPDGTARYKFVL